MDNINDILSKPAFDALEPERKEMFKELIAKLQGVGNIQAIAIVTDFMKRLPKGKELTEAEQDAMLEAFMESMPEKDRSKFKIIVNMIKSVNKA